jgi:imidazolonepropionase-like amidohydrolase
VAVEADGPDAVRRLVRLQLKRGAQCIKLMATGGAGTAGERVHDLQMTVEEMRAGVEEAHKKGFGTLAHVTTTEGVLLALEAGVDCIEHGLLLDEPAVTAMAARGTYYDPTMEAYERIVRLGTAAGYYEYMIGKAASVLDGHRRSLRLALAVGVKVVAGTDAGGHFWRLGDMAHELARMVECGMTPAQSLVAATRTGAECLGLSDDVGSLQSGRWGDVLVVDGNPLDDIQALERVWAVFKGGQRLR